VSTRLASEASSADGGAPFRPFPNEKYAWPLAAQHWLPKYPAQSAKQDEYEKEEVYLHEIEERMRSYDKKYSRSDRIKNLYNEFGFDTWDDRAQHTYGLSDDQSLLHGPGKKIDPDHYVPADPVIMNRKVIPPIQYMTAEQIRRSRGSFSNLREFPAEQPSIWKYWNGLSCLGVFTGLMIMKEWFVIGGHDFWDALLLWSIMGTVAAFLADYLAWWNALLSQESYDKEYYALLENVKRMNEKLTQLNEKPHEKAIFLKLIGHREILSEKVLQKSITNRISRVLETTQKQLENKVNEEASVKKDAETQWAREALGATYAYYDEESVKQQFTKDALERFLAPNFAKLSNEATAVTMDSTPVKTKYKELYEKSRQTYLTESERKGTLSPVFMDASRRKSLSNAERASEYESRVSEWTQGRNAVNSPTPAFS
jgi:hypothetical protein